MIISPDIRINNNRVGSLAWGNFTNVSLYHDQFAKCEPKNQNSFLKLCRSYLMALGQTVVLCGHIVFTKEQNTG